MPRSSTGKWVARAGATGGGRTYRGHVPVNWYAALIIIVVLGLLSVVYARYQYQHPATAAAATVPPTTKTTWYAGFDFYVCGKQEPPVASNLNSSAATKQSFYTTGKGLIVIAPKTTAVAGHNATLGKFVSAYKGMKLSSTQVTVPSGKKSTTYRNGQKCPAGTPDAGKKGYVQVAYWPSAFNAKGKPKTVSGDPSALRFTDNQLITIGFVPKGTTLPKPSGTVVTALLQASANLGHSTTPSSTSTTAPTSSSTTAPGSTSTTAPTSSSTTAPGSTSTTAPTSSSTTAPGK